MPEARKERGGATRQSSAAPPADRPTADQPTADQLRSEIDSGATHDKVAHSDPAAAPLGTDDEAAGTPPTADQVATARRQETARPIRDPSPADQPPHQRGMAPARGFILAIVSVLVIFAAIGIAFSW